MQVFISYAQADGELASKIREAVRAAGFDVWDEGQIMPGENWGTALAHALETSDAMVILLTPSSVHAPHITREIGYALGKQQYKGRVISVIPTSSDQLPKDQIPWILKHLQMIELNPSGHEEQSFKQITQALHNAA